MSTMPSSANQTKRISESEAGSTGNYANPTPLPVSITVRNLFPPLANIINSAWGFSINTTATGRSTEEGDGDGDGDEEEDRSECSENRNNDGNLMDKNSWNEQDNCQNTSDEDMEVCANEEGGINRDHIDDDDTDSSSDTQKHHEHVTSHKSLSPRIILPLDIKDRCAFVSSEVLLHLRLDIVFKNKDIIENENEDADKSIKEERIFSCEKSYCTAHPRWDHLNEQISLLPCSRNTSNKTNENHASNIESINNNTNDNIIINNHQKKASLTVNTNEATNNNDKTWETMYTDLYARFVIIDDPISSSTSSSMHPPTAISPSKHECILAEIPLHPSHLRYLPTANNNSLDDSSNNNISSMIIPTSLPPNAILIHYNDGHTRVLPNLYWLLIKKGIVCENATAVMTTRGRKDGEKDAHRFSEKAFDVLGDSVDATAAGNGNDAEVDDGSQTNGSRNYGDDGSEIRKGERNDVKINTTSIYGDDKLFDLLGKGEDVPNEQNTTHSTTVDRRDTDSGQIQLGTTLPSQTINTGTERTSLSHSVFEDRVFDLVGSSPTATKSNTREDNSTSASISTISEEMAKTSFIESFENNSVNEELCQSIPLSLPEEDDNDEDEIAKLDPEMNNAMTIHAIPPIGTMNKSNDRNIALPLVELVPPILPSPPLLPLTPPLPPLPVLSTKKTSTSQSLSIIKDEVEELQKLVLQEQMLLQQEQQDIYWVSIVFFELSLLF